MTLFRFLLVSVLLLPVCGQAWAQAAVPVETVETEVLQPHDVQGLVVMELFSSQACVFCPKADRLLGDLSSMSNLIALTCHVDYYDVSVGSLARPFCTARQNAYAETLRSGPVYMPQLIINGAYDVVGHRLTDISKAVKEASRPGLAVIDIQKVAEPARYRISLKAIEVPKIVTGEETGTADTGVYDLWLAFIDKPHHVVIAEGSNKGTDISYYDVVSDMFPIGQWDGRQKKLQVNLKTLSRNQAFVVLAQKPGGEIVAAGRENLIPMPAKISDADDGDQDWFDFLGLFED